MSETFQVEVLVVGGGVVGLAIAERLSQKHELFLLEKRPQFGQECSSRNSEVIHSGIYYPRESNKTRWCIDGRIALYEYATRHGVGFQPCGKYVVSTNTNEQDYLSQLQAHCKAIDVPCEFKTAEQIMRDEPLIKVCDGLYFPTSGIVDSHEFMQSLEQRTLHHGGTVAYRHQVLHAEKTNSHWNVEVEGPEGRFQIQTSLLINAAGLGAAELYQKLLVKSDYEHRFCRGRYFALSSKYQKCFQHLIYPVPQKDGLGVHVTIDLAGTARLGPDVDWSDDHLYRNHEHLYECDWESLRPSFLDAVQRYCPNVKENEMSEALIGIRAKLFKNGEAHRDFVIHHENGSIHCLGIESPGLTSSLEIAKQVQALL